MNAGAWLYAIIGGLPDSPANLRLHPHGIGPATAEPMSAYPVAVRYRLHVKRSHSGWIWMVIDTARARGHRILRASVVETWAEAITTGLQRRNEVEQAWAWGEAI